MTYTLHLGSPGAEPYKYLSYEELVQQFTHEVRQSITDMGSEGYDPDAMLKLMGVDYDADDDPEGELWNAAVTAEIERLTWRFVHDNKRWLTDMAQRGRLPDNIEWWVTEDDDDA